MPFKAFGDVAERTNALVLKTSVGKLTEGSNPSVSAIFAGTLLFHNRNYFSFSFLVEVQ